MLRCTHPIQTCKVPCKDRARKGHMSEASEPHIYIVHGRGVDLFDDVDEAKRHAWYASNSDEGWFDKLEVVALGGEVTTLKRKDLPELDQWDNEQDASYRERRAAKPHVANLSVDGTPFESFYGDSGTAEARAKYEHLLPYLGDRLELVDIKAKYPAQRW